MKAHRILMFFDCSEENYDPEIGKHARHIDCVMPSNQKVDPPYIEDEAAYPYVCVPSDTWNALQRAIDEAGVREQIKQAVMGRIVFNVRADRVMVETFEGGRKED